MALGRGAPGLGFLGSLGSLGSLGLVLPVLPVLLVLVPSAVLGEDCQAYIDYLGNEQPAQSCPYFCCGSCILQFCCSNEMLRFDGQQLQCNLHNERVFDSGKHLEAIKKIQEESRKIRESLSNNWISDSDLKVFEDDDGYISVGPSFGTLIAIGVTVFAVIVITIVLCLTCSCCCLYKACRRPQPVVTTTTATTVVHAPYPQQPAVPPSYPVAPYQGYQPVAIQPQPGMPVAPYPAQYPPPYPMQPSGPPAYHETVAAGAGAPYPSQPPYNPAYMDPQKPTY